MSLRVAVVGVGYLGQHHARIYAELPGVELVGVADTDGEQAAEVARKYKTRAVADYTDLLDRVDALSIAVPTTQHWGIARECLRAGKDILIEKPIASTVSEADDLIQESEKNGCILQVGHLERFNPGVIALSGIIREPRLLEAVRLSPFLSRGCDVDVTVDLMIHDIEIVLDLVRAPIKSMKAFGFTLMTDKIDEARAWIEFENGAVASLTASRISAEKQRRLKVFEKDHCMELDYQTGVVAVRSSLNPTETEIIRSEMNEPLREELKDFVRCIIQRDRPKVSGIEGREALRVALEVTTLMECPA